MPAFPVTTLGNPRIVASKLLESKESKFVELRELTYIAANGTEVCRSLKVPRFPGRDVD